MWLQNPIGNTRSMLASEPDRCRRVVRHVHQSRLAENPIRHDADLRLKTASSFISRLEADVHTNYEVLCNRETNSIRAISVSNVIHGVFSVKGRS